MSVAELRALLAELDDGAPVLIDGDYCPVEIRGFDRVFTSVGDTMAWSISLIPVRNDDDEDYDDE